MLIKKSFNRKGETESDQIFGILSFKMLHLDGKDVYKIQIKPSRKPCIVYKDCTLSEDPNTTISYPIFYLRETTTTQPLNPADFMQYWETRNNS